MEKMENLKKTKFISVRQISTMAIMAALGIVAAMFIKFPLIPSVEFMTYDPDDIPVLLVTIIYGPLSGIMTAFVVCLFEFLIHSTTGLLGILMHFIASATLALVVGLLLKNKNIKIVPAIILGGLASAATMVALNPIITPIYMGISREAVLKLIVPAIIPFNLVKVVLNTTLTYLLYRGLKGKTNLLKKN